MNRGIINLKVVILDFFGGECICLSYPKRKELNLHTRFPFGPGGPSTPGIPYIKKPRKTNIGHHHVQRKFKNFKVFLFEIHTGCPGSPGVPLGPNNPRGPCDEKCCLGLIFWFTEYIFFKM